MSALFQGKGTSHTLGIIDAIAYSTVDIVLCKQLRYEIFKVIKYPRLKDSVSTEKLNRLFTLLKNEIRDYTPDCTISECRDPKDNFLLELAVSAGADNLVTGDQDLLTLNPFRGVQIVKPSEFEKILDKGRA